MPNSVNRILMVLRPDRRRRVQPRGRTFRARSTAQDTKSRIAGPTSTERDALEVPVRRSRSPGRSRPSPASSGLTLRRGDPALQA